MDLFMQKFLSTCLPPWSRVILEKLTVSHTNKKFPAF